MTLFVVGSYASAESAGIHVLAWDGSRRMEPVGACDGVQNPSFVAVDGHRIYAVSEVGLADSGSHGSVHAFRMVRGDPGVDLACPGDCPWS